MLAVVAIVSVIKLQSAGAFYYIYEISVLASLIFISLFSLILSILLYAKSENDLGFTIAGLNVISATLLFMLLWWDGVLFLLVCPLFIVFACLKEPSEKSAQPKGNSSPTFKADNLNAKIAILDKLKAEGKLTEEEYKTFLLEELRK